MTDNCDRIPLFTIATRSIYNERFGAPHESTQERFRRLASRAHTFERIAAAYACLDMAARLKSEPDLVSDTAGAAAYRHVSALLVSRKVWRERIAPVTGEAAARLDNESEARRVWRMFLEGLTLCLPASADNAPDYLTPLGRDASRLLIAAARAAHDVIHFVKGYAFDAAGEKALALEVAALAWEANDKETAAFILVETYGQAFYHEKMGAFPVSQTAFNARLLPIVEYWFEDMATFQVAGGIACTRIELEIYAISAAGETL